MCERQTPKAFPGEHVMVKNYRAKDRWEAGTCVSAEYSLTGTVYSPNDWWLDKGHWQYTVMLDRTSRAGNRVWVYVGDGSINVTRE